MSITRSFLKSMSLTDEQVGAIIEAHLETVNGLKEEVTKAQQGATGLQDITKERDELKKTVETLTASGNNAAKIQADFDAYKAQVAAERTNASKTNLVKAALKSAGANEAAIDLLLKTVDLNAVELDGDKLKDEASVLNPVKATYGGLFGTVSPSGTPPVTPPNGGSSGDLMDIEDDAAYYRAIYNKNK